MSADGQLPMGVRHDDTSDPQARPWLCDDEPHHAGDDDDQQARRGMKTHRETASPDALAETKRVAPDVIAASEQAARSIAGSSPAALALPEPDEPERLACRQCGKPWDEPRLSPDGVCPLCREDLEER